MQTHQHPRFVDPARRIGALEELVDQLEGIAARLAHDNARLEAEAERLRAALDQAKRGGAS